MMKEQEYCDLVDLESAKTVLAILRRMNCFDEPNKSLRAKAIVAAIEIQKNLLSSVNIEDK